MATSDKTKEIKKDPAVHIKFFPMDIPRFFVGMIIRIWYRPKLAYISDKRPDKHSGALVIANHSSFSDPIILGTVLPRRIYYLAGELAMGKGLKTVGLRGCGCIGIDRNISDIDGIRKSVNVMKRGHYLLMFPQGSLKRDGQIREIKSGAVLMAWQAGVPILPVYVKKGLKGFHRALAMVGEEFYLSDYCDKKMPSMKDIANLTDMLALKMHECERAYFDYIDTHNMKLVNDPRNQKGENE